VFAVVDQRVSRLVTRLDDVMADAGYARVETMPTNMLNSAATDMGQLGDIVATLRAPARAFGRASLDTPPGRPRRIYTYRDGAPQRPS
jgi:hypothetical protein